MPITAPSPCGAIEQPGDQRRFAARDLVVERQQDHRAEQRDARSGRPSRPRPRSRPSGTGRRRRSGSACAGRGRRRRRRRAARVTRGSHALGRGERAMRAVLRDAEDDQADSRGQEREPAPVQHRLLACPSAAARPAARPDGSIRRASSRPTIPTGRFTKKIQRHDRFCDDRAADDRPEHRGEQHRHADDAHHAAHAAGPRGLGQRDHPDRHDHAAGEALQHAEADQRLGAPRQAAEAAGHDEGARRRSSRPASGRSARRPNRSAGSPSRARAGNRC